MVTYDEEVFRFTAHPTIPRKPLPCSFNMGSFVNECRANIENGWHGIHKNSAATAQVVPATRPDLEWACHSGC
jgi:hypothetical protein